MKVVGNVSRTVLPYGLLVMLIVLHAQKTDPEGNPTVLAHPGWAGFLAYRWASSSDSLCAQLASHRMTDTLAIVLL